MITQYKENLAFRLCVKNDPRITRYVYVLFRTHENNYKEQVNEFENIFKFLDSCNLIRGE
jgi:hypothetical protein